MGITDNDLLFISYLIKISQNLYFSKMISNLYSLFVVVDVIVKN